MRPEPTQSRRLLRWIFRKMFGVLPPRRASGQSGTATDCSAAVFVSRQFVTHVTHNQRGLNGTVARISPPLLLVGRKAAPCKGPVGWLLGRVGCESEFTSASNSCGREIFRHSLRAPFFTYFIVIGFMLANLPPCSFLGGFSLPVMPRKNECEEKQRS